MDVAFAAARDRLGQTLCGKYQLEEVIGIGGTAVVYRASHRNGHKVAVKMLHDYLCKSREVSRRFMREGYLANILDHPGTVRVLDDDTTSDGVAFLVLEMLEGETLEERRVRLGGVLPLDEVMGFADQLLSVLQSAHDKSIVHRDIKPSNLFLTTDGVLKVLDFGIARLVNEGSATATKTGTMIGTPAFMPPEQALSKPREIDAQSDIWSVGATMFTLLSGELVHVAESSSEHLVKAATMRARSIAKVLPGVPSNVEALIARAMFFNKSERWSSALEMRQELWRVRLEPGRPLGTVSAPPPVRGTASDFPTFVDTRESGGLAKPAHDSDSRMVPWLGRRGLVALALFGMLLVVGGATLAAYGAAARGPTKFAAGSSSTEDEANVTARPSPASPNAQRSSSAPSSPAVGDAPSTSMAEVSPDARTSPPSSIAAAATTATSGAPSGLAGKHVPKTTTATATTRPAAPKPNVAPSHGATPRAGAGAGTGTKSAGAADLYRPF